MPGVDDLEFPLGHDCVAVALVEQFVAVVKTHRGPEELCVVDAADELPLAGHAPTVAVPLCTAHRGGGTRHDGHGIGNQFGAAVLEPGPDQSECLDADHEVPAGAAVCPRGGLDDADLDHGIGVGTVDVPGSGKSVQPVLRERLGNRCREVANAFRLVGVSADQRCQALCRQYVVLGCHANECNPASFPGADGGAGVVRVAVRFRHG